MITAILCVAGFYAGAGAAVAAFEVGRAIRFAAPSGPGDVALLAYVAIACVVAWPIVLHREFQR